MYPSVEARTLRVRRIRIMRAAVVGLLLAAQVLAFEQATNPGRAEAAPAVAQTYYTPYEAQQYIDILRTIADNPACCTSPVTSTVSVTSGADGNFVYYDHFEDGYEADPLNPVQGSTLTLAMDAGDVWTQTSSVPVDVGGSRGPGNYFDGRDRIVSTAPIAATQTGYASDSGTLLAGGVGVLDVDKSGVRFDIPAGQDADYNSLFEYVGLVIVGTVDDTTVSLDLDANGSLESSAMIGEGETYVVDGGVNLGAAVEADHPVSVYVSTGDVGATFESRFFELYPTAIWSGQSVSPVGSYTAAFGTRVFLFNPRSSAIDVDVLTGGGGTATVTVGAGAQTSYLMPVDAGARFTSQGGEPFYAFQLITTEGTSTSAYDWGYTLVPGQAATPSVIVPYAPGSEGLTNNYSPVWVSPSADTTLYVDRDGDPTTGASVDSIGNRYDFSCAVGAFDSVTVYDDGTANCYLPSQSSAAGGDRDLTGARFYTLDGTRLAAAWGQRPGYTGGAPALDMGTTILPFPEILMSKSSVLSTDQDGDGLADSGDEITYTVTMVNLGIVDVSGVVLTDETPDHTGYVAATTILDSVAQADDTGPWSVSPLDADSPSGGLVVGVIPAGATRIAEFAVVVDAPIPFGVSEVVNTAVMITQYGPTSATDRRQLDVPPLHIVKSSSVSGSPVGSGDTVTYTIQVHNGDPTPQTGVVVTDSLPPGVTYAGGSVAADVDGTPVASGAPPALVSGVTLPVDGMLTITFDVTVDSPIAGGITGFTNTAETQSDQYPTPTEASVTDPVSLTADLSLIKTDDEIGPVSPSDRLVYSITITNAGPDEAAGVVVVDTLPPGVTFVPGASDGSCTEAPAGTVTCVVGDLGVGSTVLDIAVDIGSATDGVITNSATVSSDTPEGNPGDETDDEDTVVDVPPSITVDKEASPIWVPEPGGTVTFLVTVTNESVEAVTLTSLSDDVFGDLLDIGNTAVTASTCPSQSTSIPMGGAFACSFDGLVSGDSSGPDHVDVITASVVDDDGTAGSESDDAEVSFVDTVPTLTIEKDPSATSLDEPGGTATFTVTVTNDSSETLTVDALTDDVFGNLLDPGNGAVTVNSCVSLPSTIAAGAAFGCSFDAAVGGSAVGPDHVDTVTVMAHDDEDNPVSAYASATVGFDDVEPVVNVSKDASAASVAEPGGSVAFDVIVDNLSVEPVTITSLVDDVFGDLLDAGNLAVTGNTCPSQSTSVAAGDSFECSFSADVMGLFGDTDHVDRVDAAARDDEGNLVQDFDQATVSFAPAGSSVSGVVFVDADRDGVMDSAEDGMADVGLVITDSGGGGSFVVTTDSDGTWSTVVLPGPVDVEVDGSTVLAGHALTTANDAQVVTAVAGDDVAATDIGYGSPFGSISGQIYLDLDGDPDRDLGEPALAGVTVDLLDGASVIASTITDTDGRYGFADLIPLAYVVRVDESAVMAGIEVSVDPDDVVDAETDATLAPGETVDGLDFGYAGTGSLGDVVWRDADGDGVQDSGEDPLAGATVTLSWAGLDGVFGTGDDYEFPPTTTDDLGAYGFAALPPGVYRLTVDGSSFDRAMSATTPTTFTVDLGPGMAFLTADFGFEAADELPYTGIAVDHFLLAAAVLALLGGAVLVDGHRRERRWDLAIWRIIGRRPGP